jgi:hypothetical protein
MTDATNSEIDELVSHVLALRKDFIQGLFRSAGLIFSGLRKIELGDRLREAIDEGAISVTDVVRFLDAVEPGGKQHVFLSRPRADLNRRWRDVTATRRRLRARSGVRDLLDGEVPLLMPPELTLSSIRLGEDLVQIVAVEARSYFERDPYYDDEVTSEDGLLVQLRAYIQQVGRSVVVLRWDTATRHAALHITQASGRGVERDHYRSVAGRFAAAVAPWLDLTQFRDVNLHKVIDELHRRERAAGALTKSRRARFETPDGSELDVISASTHASVFADTRLTAAIDQVADPASGQSGNLVWLPTTGSPLHEPLHVTILAFDSRVNFMVPSSPEAVGHVIQQIRSLL